MLCFLCIIYIYVRICYGMIWYGMIWYGMACNAIEGTVIYVYTYNYISWLKPQTWRIRPRLDQISWQMNLLEPLHLEETYFQTNPYAYIGACFKFGYPKTPCLIIIFLEVPLNVPSLAWVANGKSRSFTNIFPKLLAVSQGPIHVVCVKTNRVCVPIAT